MCFVEVPHFKNVNTTNAVLRFTSWVISKVTGLPIENSLNQFLKGATSKRPQVLALREHSRKAERYEDLRTLVGSLTRLLTGKHIKVISYGLKKIVGSGRVFRLPDKK